jgi:NAD(P)-dependent dehydrogenase (short-subunit alcohol dehydrogenase family)
MKRETKYMPGQISFDLKGSVVMITGTGRGIGKAIALACAHAGADLALGSRHVEECEQVAAAVIYLSSDAGRFVTGHTLLVDGGFTAV